MLPSRSLPPEILARIVAFLLPVIDPYDSTYPHPRVHDLDYVPPLQLAALDSLRSVSPVSTWFYQLSTEALWRTPLLRNLKALNRLSLAIRNDVKARPHSTTRASLIRALHLPPGDGLLQTGDTLAEQNAYGESLRTVFDHASRIDCLAIEHRQAGSALLEFLSPRTTSRPTNVTLSNLSFSAPPFSSLDLAPLSAVQRLHLIKVVPPPALISFLCGVQINHVEQGKVPLAIQNGLSPHRGLTHLRLSLLPPDTLLHFQAYIDWRRAWAVFETLSPQQQANNPAPRAPLGPARRFAVQEALYDLAVHSRHLVSLRLLILEMSALAPLLSPEESAQEDEYSATSLTSSRIAMPNGENLAQIDPRADPNDTIPPYLGDGSDVNEDTRTRPRQEYWSSVQDGKRALLELWTENQTQGATQATADGETAPATTEIRLVAARPGGHDRTEGYLDYLCQSQAFVPASALDRNSSRREMYSIVSESTVEMGCWADEDVFHLAQTRPYLTYRRSRYPRTAPGGGIRVWWTGELPRPSRTQHHHHHHHSSA
ncbi:hypothetical protein BCV70DRAFT_158258 [Testicularia cyperi]|uniref:Uncharacterized protein n=1 Tax=Testicularia cyperi TaxID=1882483 RepID=A0A317XWK0_9BASI|nr:hypothetical protein BCV70DRAFT_158258 [Testicularia cyperi]